VSSDWNSRPLRLGRPLQKGVPICVSAGLMVRMQIRLPRRFGTRVFLQALFASLVAWVAWMPAAAWADWRVNSRGEFGAETRFFQDDNDPGTQDYGVAAVGRLQIDLRQRPFKIRVRGFARHDEADRGRSAFFPEEAWVQWRKDRLSLRAGWDLLNWTATEAFHPADLVNSRYFDSNVENFEKIGEFMFQARIKVGQGNVTAYVMPHFASPIFPSSRSRLSFLPAGFSLGEPYWVRRSGNVADKPWGFQWALRVQQLIGDADVSLHIMQHQDRFHPWVDPLTTGLRPVFLPLTQVAGTYQQVFGAWVVKVEAAYRSFDHDAANAALSTPFEAAQIPNRDHAIAAAGLEYGVSLDSLGWDTIYFLEAQSIFFEGGDLSGDREIRRSLNLFQRDVLAGVRVDLQDEDSTTLNLFVAMDLERRREVFANLGASRRLGETFTISAGVRFFHLPPRDPNQPIAFEQWHKNNSVYLNLLRHF